jgi:hypothetical protein
MAKPKTTLFVAKPETVLAAAKRARTVLAGELLHAEHAERHQNVWPSALAALGEIAHGKAPQVDTQRCKSSGLLGFGDRLGGESIRPSARLSQIAYGDLALKMTKKKRRPRPKNRGAEGPRPQKGMSSSGPS